MEKISKPTLSPLYIFAVWQGDECTFVKCNWIDIIEGGMLKMSLKHEDGSSLCVGLFSHFTRAVLMDGLGG